MGERTATIRVRYDPQAGTWQGRLSGRRDHEGRAWGFEGSSPSLEQLLRKLGRAADNQYRFIEGVTAEREVANA